MITQLESKKLKRLIVCAKEARFKSIGMGDRFSYDDWIKAEQAVEDYINSITEPVKEKSAEHQHDYRSLNKGILTCDCGDTL